MGIILIKNVLIILMTLFVISATLCQAQTVSVIPEGYNLVWSEEFNAERHSDGKPALPDTKKWWYENLPKGAVNNELQTYVGGFRGNDTVAAIYDGTLKIIAQKSGNDVISARINTIEA